MATDSLEAAVSQNGFELDFGMHSQKAGRCTADPGKCAASRTWLHTHACAKSGASSASPNHSRMQHTVVMGMS